MGEMEKAMDLKEMARIIRGVTYNSYNAVLVGSAPRCVHEFHERMKRLEPGMLVVETSTIGMAHRDLDAVGYLLEVTREPVDFGDPDFVWDEAEEGRPHPTEPVHYIRLLDGTRYRWTNARFISAPHELLWLRPAAPTQEAPADG